MTYTANWVDAETFADLDRLAVRLEGLKVGHINATSRAGGVAKILRSFVPLMNGLGDPFFLDFHPKATFFFDLDGAFFTDRRDNFVLINAEAMGLRR